MTNTNNSIINYIRSIFAVKKSQYQPSELERVLGSVDLSNPNTIKSICNMFPNTNPQVITQELKEGSIIAYDMIVKYQNQINMENC